MQRAESNSSLTRPLTFTVVITGGIASGKTTVSDHFALLGVPVIDMDQIAHEIVEPGSPALQTIRRQFGPEFLDESGRLERSKLRKLIFADAKARAKLEDILHPLIIQEALSRISAVTYSYCIIVIPLFVEAARWSWVDRVLVIDAAEEAQIKRLMARDGCNRNQAKAILRAQSAREDRLRLADDVIANIGTPADLDQQVLDLHKKYLRLASSDSHK